MAADQEGSRKGLIDLRLPQKNYEAQKDLVRWDPSDSDHHQDPGTYALQKSLLDERRSKRLGNQFEEEIRDRSVKRKTKTKLITRLAGVLASPYGAKTMMFVIKLKITQFIRKVVQSKPFLFALALSIGISYTSIYFVGGNLYGEIFVKDQYGMVWVNPKIIQDVQAAEIKEEVREEIVWKVGEFSAYTPRAEETDGNPYINAANKRVKDGDIACPSKYSFGTKIEVKGRRVYECMDRMNKRYAEKENFDIFMWDLEEAYAFGRRDLEYREIEK